MYYSHQCSYCHKVFYVYENDKYKASEMLYDIIKKHLKEYEEDHKEYKFDDGKSEDSLEIFNGMTTSSHKPPGGYDK
jgi:hypothetical protein